MKAARLNAVNTPLRIEGLPDPVLRPGSVLVRILAERVLSYTGEVLSGQRRVQPPAPCTPGTGGIAVIEAVAEDVFDLKPGQKVFCDGFVASRANTEPRLAHGGLPYADGILGGWFGLTEASEGILRFWKDGSFAEKALYPAENVTPIEGEGDEDDTRLAALSNLTIAYGGLLRGELRPGQSVIVTGATGNIGACAVVVALAMGAARVVAVGRDTDTLATLERLDPKRVVTVTATGDREQDANALREAAGGADVFLDALGTAQTPDLTLAAILSLRPAGHAVFMGGVATDIPIPYSRMLLMGWTLRGSFMYPRSAPAELLRMIAAGTLDLSAFTPHEYPLDRINDAVADAPSVKGLDFVVVTP